MLSRARASVHRAAPLLVRRRTRATGGVALTFDDGPDPSWTPQLLDLLDELDVRATFFVVGRAAAARPDLVARIAAGGHGLGSHTWTHPAPWSMSGAELAADYRAGRRAVEDAAGRAVPLFRPPQGHLGLWESLAVRRLRAACWLWTVDSGDWRPGVDADDILAAAAAAEQGDVVLLHDALADAVGPGARSRAATLEAVPRVVAQLRARGLPLVLLEGA